MTVQGDLRDSDGLKPLRESVADGEIEGESYVVTQDLSSGAILVEFEDSGETVVYDLPSIVQDAYAVAFEDEEGSDE